MSGVRLLTRLAPGHQRALRRLRGMVRWCSVMRSITKAVAPLIIGFCSVSCSTTPSSDTDAAWLAEGGARLLADVFRSVDLQVVREGKHLSVAGKRIDVDALVENRAQRSGRQILAAAFRITIGGTLVPAFQAGTIGIDATVEGARATAVEEWGAEYGTAIGYAVAKWLGADGAPKTGEGVSRYRRVEVDGHTLHYGLTAVRGLATDAATISSEQFVRNIAKRAVPLMGSRDRFRSATVKIQMRGATVETGECRVNGMVSPTLFAELQKIRWPDGNARFIYTLFFAEAPDAV
jgi:hypothetical protein